MSAGYCSVLNPKMSLLSFHLLKQLVGDSDEINCTLLKLQYS